VAILKPVKPFVQYNNQLDPARLYSRPALPPWYQGMNGFGQARAYANKQFEYTMQQMAVSPFSVNSRAYMERIRNETGLDDTGLYDVFGTIGGVVGAGVGAALGSGFLKLPKYEGGFKFWKDGNFKKWDTDLWTGKFNPKRTSIHNTAFKSVRDIQTYNKNVDVYNNSLTKLKNLENSLGNMPSDVVKAAKDFNEASATRDLLATELSDLQTKYNKAKYRSRSNPTRVNIENRIKEVTKSIDDANIKMADVSKYGDITKVTDTLKDIDRTSDAVKTATNTLDTSVEALRASGVAVDGVTTGAKISTKTAGFIPWAGITLDTASLGISTAGLVQSIEQGDTFNIVFNTLATAADAASVVGDILEFTPAAPIGSAISIIAGVVSIGISALQGWLVGKTVGHSLSPEGMKAQQMYAENLYASMIQRPITSLATTASIVMLPLTFNALAGAKDTNILSKIGLRWVGKQLTDSAIGNQVRAGVSMLTLQGISSMTSKLDEALPWAPEDPEDVNFVSAISLYGDINDNIYGATRNKSILVGLLSGDSSAMTKALARSWGYSDEMYKSVSFDDVREAAGLELSPIGNSLFSTLGEILIDPQNYAEVAQKISMDRVTGSFVKVFNKSLDIATGKAYMQDGIGIKGTLEELVDVNGLFYNMPSKDRARTISRLFTSYLEGGKEQLQKDITALAIHRGKGSRSRNQTTVLTSVDAQFDILAKSFDDIIKGDFRYMIASDGAKTELLNSVRTYEIIKRKIANKERLSDEEFKIKDKLLTAFSHMEKIYGVEETPAFVKSFIEDLDLKLSSEHVRMLYRDFTQLQDHMGISDFFSRAIINIANPNAYLTRKSISSVRKFFEHLRYRASSTAKKAKTILKFQEVKDNLPRLITTEEVKNIYKGYSEGNKSFEDVINTAYKSNETINKLMDPAFEERIEGPRDIHTETSKQIASAKKALDDTIQTKKDKQQLVYIPTNTKFADGETVYVDEEKLPKLEEDIIKKYETGLDGKPLTREQVRAKYNRDIHSRVEAIRKEARRYKRTYDAVIEYKYHNMYYELLYDLSAQLHASISIMDIVSIAENEEYTNVLRTYTLLKTFVNSRRTITRAEKIALDMIRVEDLKKKHEDSVKALTKSIDKLKEKLETAKGVRRLDINKELITFEKDLKNSKKLLEKYTKEFDALTKSATNVKENEKIHVDIYDSYNWDMLTDENLDVFELTLRRYGIDLVVFDKDGNRVKTDNLKNTVKILKTNRDLKLQLALKESVRQIVQGIIFEYLPISDTEILMHAITNYPIAFTKEEWLKMNNLEKFEALEDYLNSLPFDSSILKHADKDVMLKIFTQINKAISSESTKVRYVQLEDVDDTVIRRAVMSKFYDMSDKDRQTVKVRSIVDAAIKQLKQASANYNTLLSTPELNDNAEFLDVLNNLIMRVNFNLTSNTAYQFFKSYFYPSFKKDTKSVNIFLSPFVKREVFPRPVYKSEKEDIKSSKTDYTEVEIINRYADARALNHEFKKVEKQWEYIKHKGTEKADLTTEEVVKEDLAERRSEREIEKNRVKSLKKRTKNSLEKTLPMFKDITVDMINNFRVGATLTDKVIYNLPFFKPYAIKNRPDLKKKLLVSILKGELEYLDLDKITFEYVPSKYGDENTKDAKGLKDYYKVLEQFRRTSPEHQNALKRLAKQLISLERSGKIFIVRDALVKVKKYDYEDDTDVLVRRIITTYKEKKSIKVESKVNKHANLKLTKLFRNSIVKSAADYMYANKGKSDLFDSKDEYLLEDIEKFLYKLTEDDIDNIDKVSEAIINKAIPIFNRYVADGIYTDAQINLKELGDNLLEFEQRDIRALSERHYVMSSDVAMKLIMGSKEMLALVDDIINFGDIEDFSIDGTYGTTLFDLAHILNSYINTNRRNKLTFNEDKVTDVRYDATKEMIMFTIDGKEVSLFDLMFVYNFNLHTISSLIKHVGLLKANNQEALDNIKDLNVRMITLYNSLYDKWGDIFSHNNFNISKELFIQTYGEDSAEDYDFLTDFNNTSTYNRLSLIDYLETDVKEFTPYEGFTGDVYEREVDKHKNMPTYLNEEAAALYRKAKKNLNNKHTYKGKPVHPRNTEELFLLYLLESDIKDKKTILENVFFPDLKVGHGKYSQTHIKELEEYLEDYKTNLEKSTTDKGKRILEQKIERLTMMLESVKARDKKVYGHNLDTFDKRFEYVLEHDGDGILSVYRNVIDTDSNEYVFALDPTTDTYYLVKHKDSKGNSNVNEDDVKGVPNYNYTIGENILKESKPDSKIFKQAVDVINKDLYWQETLGSNFEVKAVTDKSIIITVENPKLYQSVTNKLIQTIRKDTNIKNLFILTPKQLEDIQAMVDNDSTYVIDYDYKIKKNDDGSIKGLVPNMINVKGSKVKAAKYLNDLGVIIESAMHQKKKVDDVVSDMQKYAELFKNKIVVHRSYVDSVDFNKSEVFRDLYNQAKVTKAFIEFIEVIDPTKTLEAVNLDRLASMFFRNEYIRTQEDGSLADLSSDTALLNNITDINLRAQLKKITVNGTPLITLVRKSLQNLQEKYKDTNIYYTYSQVLTTEFRDTVNTLKQRIYSIYSTMSTTHKDIIKYVLPALKKKQKQGMITGITSEEVQERRRLTKKYTKAMFDKTNPKKYSHYVRQPYANVKARNEVINELKRDFYFKDPDKYNYTNEALMKADMSRLRTTHERRTREINNARNNKKREGLNLKLFWYAFKQKKNAHDIAATKSEKNNYIRVDKPYKFDFLDAEKLEVLRPFIKEAYPNFKGLFDTYETLRKDGDKDKYLPYYYSLQSIGDLHFRIDNEEDFFNVVVYNLFNSYLNKIAGEVIRKTDREINLSITMASQGLSPEEASAKLQAALEAEWNKKVDLKIKPEYRTVVIKDDDGDYEATLEDAKVHEFFIRFIHGIDDTKIDQATKAMVDVFNYFEELLFKPSDIKIHETTEDLVLKNDFKTIDEYINTLPKHLHNGARFLIDFIIYKNYDKKPSEYGLVPDNEGQIKIDLDPEKFLNIVTGILRKDRDVKFENSYEVFKLMSTPLLNRDKDFKNYVVNEYFKLDRSNEEQFAKAKAYLRQFGIDKDTQINLFNNMHTMADIISSLSYEISKDQMYALVAILNMVEERYINDIIFDNKGKSADEIKKWSWKDAYEEVTTKALAESIDKIDGLQATNVFSGHNAFGNSVLTGINDSVDFMFEHLAYVEDTNKVLNAMIIPRDNTPKEVFDLNAKYITTSESNMMTETKKFQRNLFKHIFIDEATISANSERRLQFEKVFGDPILHLIEEGNATSLENVASQNEVYIRLMELYTEVMKIVRTNHGPTQFVRMLDITTAFKSLSEHPDAVGFYSSLFDMYVSKITDQTKANKHINAVKQIEKYFNKQSFLINVNEQLAKATLGYILRNRFELKNFRTDDLVKEYLEYSKKQAEASHYLALKRYKDIAYRLNLADDLNSIVKIIYDKDETELDKDELSTVQAIMILKRAIKSGIGIDPKRLWDTYVVQLLARKESTYENLTVNETVYGKLSEELAKLDKQLDTLQRSQRARYSKRGTIDEAKKALAVLQDDLDKQVATLEDLNKEREAELKKLDKAKYQAKLNIIYYNPELLTKYIIERNTNYTDSIAKFNDKVSKMKSSYPQVFLDEHARRNNIYDKHREFFDSEEFDLFKSIRREVRLSGIDTLNTVAKKYAGTFKRLDISNINDWYSDMENKTDQVDKEQIELKKNVILKDDKGWNINYKNVLRSMTVKWQYLLRSMSF